MPMPILRNLAVYVDSSVVKGSSSTIPHSKPFSGMLQAITDINRLKVRTLSCIIFVLYSGGLRGALKL